MKIQTLFGSLEELERKEQLRKEGKLGFLDRMKDAAAKTRDNLNDRIEQIVSFNKEIDANTLDDLEASLIAADLGSTTTHEILSALREEQSCLIVTGFFLEAFQLVQALQIDAPAAALLLKRPILIAARQQIAPIQLHRRL